MFTIIVELFNAGTDSTSTILAWAILYLTNNPEIQDKCRREIHQVCVLIDFSLTVKAATLIFISGRGSAISSAKEEKSGSVYNLVKS